MASPGRGLDRPLTTAPQAWPIRRARPTRPVADRSRRSSSPARNMGRCSARSAREPPKEVYQITQ